MLNLFNIKENKKSTKTYEISKVKKTLKHFPSPVREWENSIYVYNKNGFNLIPSTTISASNIIKSYFHLYNKGIEMKMRTKRLLLRLRRLSSNKYYVSNGGFKHTNNKVLINLYVFNRQKINYILTLKKWYLNRFLKKISRNNLNVILISRLRLINNKGKKVVESLYKNKHLLANKDFNVNIFKDLSKYLENFYKSLIQKSFKKLKIYFFYKQLLYINKAKLNYTYLQLLKKHLEKLYNKNVEFNIINIKRFYLNSDILSESMTLKISKNRRKLLRYFNNLKNKVKIEKKNFLNNSFKHNYNKLYNISNDNLLLQKFIFNNLKYKHVTGFRLEAKGRLSKRFTASRSLSKLRYKGNLLDIDSSYRGLSSVILKGNLKSNTQYTKLKSKSRIGSFGIKGWVSGN